MAAIAEIADAVTKVLSVGASGFAVVLAFMSYRLIEQPPSGDGGDVVRIYESRLRTATTFLLITLVFFVIALVGQYFLDKRSATLELVIQESKTLEKLKKDLNLDPIKVTQGDLEGLIPTQHGKDRLFLIVRGEGKIDISLNSLVEHIRDQATLLREKDRQIASSTRQGGASDEAR